MSWPRTLFSHLFLDFTTKNQTLSEKVKLLKMKEKKKNVEAFFKIEKEQKRRSHKYRRKLQFLFFNYNFGSPPFYITWYASKSIDSYQSSNYWPSIIRFPNRSLLSERKNFLHSCIILFVLANIIIEILDDWC